MQSALRFLMACRKPPAIIHDSNERDGAAVQQLPSHLSAVSSENLEFAHSVRDGALLKKHFFTHFPVYLLIYAGHCRQRKTFPKFQALIYVCTLDS